MDNLPISSTANSFSTFGDLLKFLRRRARLTQLELSIAVGYSEAQISRLEKNQRLPDLAALQALFIPALHVDDPQLTARFLELAQSTRQEDAPTPGIAPYKGMLFFEEEDSKLFFGREAITSQLASHVMDLARNASARFLAIVGASGSGKSSLVRAGLAVALKRAGWEVSVFTPTAHPLRLLQANLNAEQTKSAERFMLLVDQFEEVFTLCHDEMERIIFIEELLACAQDRSKRITVVIALRADFYSHCAQYPLLRKAVAAEQEYIGQMTVEELRCAIEEPAKRGGWELEPGLVDILLQDLGTHRSHEPEPGALPLLSHALLATWEHRHGNRLTLGGYHASGGVRGAIAETAESVFTDQLNQVQQEIARDVFLRLTELGAGTEDTHRRTALNELVRQNTEATQLRMVLNILAEARLITLNEDSAEVAHEALIREWQRLHNWLTQDREGLLLHRHLTESAHEWEARAYDPAELYRGARLAQVHEWASTNVEKLNEVEQAFLDACLKQERRDVLEREAQGQRELDAAQKLADTQLRAAQQLRSRALFLNGALTLVLILASIALSYRSAANQNATQARSEQRIAISRELAAAAINNLDEDPERSILLALKAQKSADTLEAQNALHRSIFASHVRRVLSHDSSVWGVAYRPDGKQIATASQDKTARIWDADTGELIMTLTGHGESVNSIAYSPDGNRIATGSSDRTAKVWDALTGKELFTLSDHADVVRRVTFSPSGNRLATVSGKSVHIWDARTGDGLLILKYSEPLSDIAFTPDGLRIASSTLGNREGKVIIWDAISGKQLSSFSTGEIDPFTAIAFSPDGTRIAASALSVMAIVWDVNTGQELMRLTGHKNRVNDIVFSPDGKWLATGSQDHTAKIWDPFSGKEMLTLYGHSYGVNRVAFSPDGKQLVTASLDGTARVWDITPEKELTFIPVGGNPRNLTLSSDGTRVLTDDSDNMPKIWDATSGRLLRTYDAHFDLDVITVLSPSGKLVAAVSENHPVVVWDAPTGTKLFTLPKTSDLIWNMTFSPDEKLLATASTAGTVIIWNLASGTALLTLDGHAGPVFDVAFRPGGQQLASVGQDKTVKIWSAKTGELLRTLSGHADIIWKVAYTYNPEGMLLGTASRDGTAKIWDADSGKELLTLRGHNGIVDSIAFSQGGKWIATGSWDGSARIWSSSTGSELLSFPVGGPVGGVSFSRDGTRFALKGGSGGIYIFLLPVDDLVALAKLRVTRSLTIEECQQYLHTAICPTEP